MQLTKVDANSGCQPLKQTVPAVPLRDIAFKNAPIPCKSPVCCDTYTKEVEDKYDYACGLAAKYKNLYFELLSKQSCNI